MLHKNDNNKKWYFNTRTNEPEYGRRSQWDEIMGPYETREDALHAWERVRARNEEWMQQESQWHPQEETGETVDGDEEPETSEAQWQPFSEWVNDPEQPNPAEKEMKERQEAASEGKPAPQEPEGPETPAALL